MRLEVKAGVLACFRATNSRPIRMGSGQVKDPAKLAIRVVAGATKDVRLGLDMGFVLGGTRVEDCVQTRRGKQDTKVCQNIGSPGKALQPLVGYQLSHRVLVVVPLSIPVPLVTPPDSSIRPEPLYKE